MKVPQEYLAVRMLSFFQRDNLPHLMLINVSYLEGPNEYWEPHNEGYPVTLFENNRNFGKNQIVNCYYSKKLYIIDYPSCQSMTATQQVLAMYWQMTLVLGGNRRHFSNVALKKVFTSNKKKYKRLMVLATVNYRRSSRCSDNMETTTITIHEKSTKDKLLNVLNRKNLL